LKIAPIVLFVYNRPWHTRQTVEALQRNKLADQSELIIFADGPKNDRARSGVREVRDYIRTIDGFKAIRRIEREEHLGLATSIISGVTEVIDEYGSAIVMEDDLISSPYFLLYMNDALQYYKNDDRVISIHAYMYPVGEELPETFFLEGANCWGWATWKRGWNLFEPDGGKLLLKLKERNLTKRFDMDGVYSYTKILKDQIAGRNDSWAIRWHASVLLLNKLTLYPGKSLVSNIGHDGSGTHCGLENYFDTSLSEQAIRVGGIEVTEDQKVLESVKRYMKIYRKKKIIRRIKRAWDFIQQGHHIF